MKHISYEWVIETLDENGDIDDVNHRDNFPGVPFWGQDIGLVLDDFSHPCMERSWAYIIKDGGEKHGRLPEYFENAYGHRTRKVPVRFHAEVEKWWKERETKAA